MTAYALHTSCKELAAVWSAISDPASPLEEIEATGWHDATVTLVKVRAIMGLG
jgi:hypothetical protein